MIANSSQPMSQLMMPKTAATTTAPLNPRTSKPGRIRAVSQKAALMINQESRISSIANPLYR
jgi:hypothetical protein